MLGRFLCWLTGKHKWQKLRRVGLSDNGVRIVVVPPTEKMCARCGILRPVKTRVAKVKKEV